MSELLARQPSSRVAQKRDARTEQILDRAMELLTERGIEGLTLQSVAEASGYVPAALYRYFGSKDGLLAALQRRAVTRLHERYRAARAELDAQRTRASEPELALTRLVHGARFFLALPSEEPEAWFLLALLLGDPRPLIADDEAQKTAPLLFAFLAEIQQLFVAARELGALDPGDDLRRTLAYWAALQGVLSLEKARRIVPMMPSAAEVGLVQAQAMLLGWGADPKALKKAIERTG